MSANHFERAWPYLEPAVAWAQQHTKQSVQAAIERGTSRLWMTPNSAAVTELRTFFSGRKSFTVWLAGGDLKELCDLANGEALQSALDDKCNEMRILGGRRGWVRALNWREVGAIAIRDLDHA